MNNQTNALKGVLSAGTVSFHAIFAKAFRSIPVGVFLSQGYFWQENAKYRDKDKYKTVEGKTFFTMTAKEWFDETSLTQEQQTRVRETLTKHKVLIEWLTDNPARLFFHIDLDALVSVINQYIESGISVSVDNRTKNRFKTQPSLGKKPKQDSVKNLTSYNEESNESIESVREENTPAPAEISNTLEEEKNERGKVPPPPAAIPRRDPHQSQGQMIGPIVEYVASEPSDIKITYPPAEAAAPGCPACAAGIVHKAGEGCAPDLLVKLYRPETPGVIEAEGIALPEPEKEIQPWEHPNATSPKELKAVILRYAAQKPDNWRDNILESGRATDWTKERIEDCLTDFCAWQFQQDSVKGKLSQYTAGFSLWLKRQPRFEQRPQPGQSAQPSPTRVTVSTPQTQTRY